MNCLKCPNYWRTDIDETKCDQCGTHEQTPTDPQDKEVQTDEQASGMC
jgi:Zn ribbon nucleic-acid-binding protein